MKKILAFILCVSTVMTFGSCGKKDEQKNENNTDPSAEVIKTIPEDPNEYLSFVLLENSNIFSSLSNTIEDLKKSTINSASNATIDVSLGNGTKSFLKDISGNEGIYDSISWFKNASLSFDAVINDTNLMKLTTGLGINNTEIAKTDIIASLADNKVYLSLPGLSDKSLFAGIPETISDSISKLDISFLPDSEASEKLTVKFTDIIVNALNDVEKSMSELTVDNITAEATRIDIEITHENALAVSEAVIKAAIADTDIKNVITAFANINYKSSGFQTAEKMIDSIYGNMDAALKEIQNTEPSSEEVLKIALFTDSEHNITGIDIDNNNIGIIQYSYVEEEGFFSSILKIGNKTLLRGTGHIVNEFIYGNFNIYGTDSIRICTIAVDNLNLAALENGLPNGSAVINLDKEFVNSKFLPELLNECSFIFNVSSTPDKNSVLSLTVNYKEQKVLAIKISSCEKALSKITIPSDALNISDKNNINTFSSSINLGEIFTNLSNAGANNLLSQLANLG